MRNRLKISENKCDFRFNQNVYGGIDVGFGFIELLDML